MLAPTVFYHKADYVETLTLNKVSKKSVLCGSMNIRLAGKTIISSDSIIRGDLANVIIGRFSVVGEGAVIRPSYKRFKGGIAYFPLTIGDHVVIGESSVISAASIGSYVYIGKNCIISKRSILKDCCYIPDNSILPPDTVVAPFTVFHHDGNIVDELPECFQDVMRDHTIQNFDLFVPYPAK